MWQSSCCRGSGRRRARRPSDRTSAPLAGCRARRSPLLAAAARSLAAAATTSRRRRSTHLSLLASLAPLRFAAAFNLAAVVLAAAAVLACRNWTERYGDRETSAGSSLLRSWRSIRASRELMALGVFSSFYEASLYVFVFMWTP